MSITQLLVGGDKQGWFLVFGDIRNGIFKVKRKKNFVVE